MQNKDSNQTQQKCSYVFKPATQQRTVSYSASRCPQSLLQSQVLLLHLRCGVESKRRRRWPKSSSVFFSAFPFPLIHHPSPPHNDVPTDLRKSYRVVSSAASYPAIPGGCKSLHFFRKNSKEGRRQEFRYSVFHIKRRHKDKAKLRIYFSSSSCSDCFLVRASAEALRSAIRRFNTGFQQRHLETHLPILFVAKFTQT